ncbi:hypothetical protein NP233_g1751 [Leucocoprinus birnbaumii]|uniref:Uncharacterized protein n=1 Tax=Leucocoprinus birnbaumii TaxID=56174 RepID=A0AAD5YUJ5_9AGAR|nr:hypothetical protein NP233_g1751 [Leucocoprinus birnbaumii]
MEPREYELPNPNKQNQGIVDGRAAGANPPQAKVLGDTVIDTDASADSPVIDTSAFRGPESSVTSQDVHQGYGHPGSGMSSKEARHGGKQQYREHEGSGVSQWGSQKTKDVELDRAQRPTGDNVGPTSGV